MSQGDELRSLLARVRRRWFALTALTIGGRAAAAAAVPFFAAAIAGRLLAPSGAMSVVLALLAAGAAAGVAGFLLWRMQRRPDDCHVARFIEERTGTDGVAPALSDALVSAVQIVESPERHPGAFAELIVSNAVNVLRHIERSTIIPRDAMPKAALRAFAGAAILVVALVWASPQLIRAGATVWVALFPQTIRITVHTGNARVRAGQPLSIAAALHGRGAELLSIVPSLVVSANGQQRAVPMTRSSDGFVHVFESVDRSFEYHVAAGRALSASYSVTALFPARVKRIDAHYDYPPFTGLGPRDEEDGGDLYAPEGTRVRLRVYTDKPVVMGHMALGETKPVALASVSPTMVAGDLVLARDDAYRVSLRDADGLESVGDVEYFIRLMDDRPPDVRIVRPAADQSITPLEEVAIEARADDDYGVAQFDLVYGVAGRASKTVPFTRTSGTNAAKIGSHLLAAEELRVQPGDVITYYARARDVARGKPSSETRSDIFFLEVKPFNEEFVAAQSQAMGAGAAGNQLDSLVAAQKEIITATWNLERRSRAGRSSADMKAVGQAQTELKARTEQMLGSARRSGRGIFPPQQIGPPPAPRRPGGTDPAVSVVEAMARAADHLQNERTADAIPHEMAALQGLLQAQAEVRRRQVMQQSASGAGQGGTNRTDRDLSALFDRELQRQQRTNYETPQQATENPERRENSDALDRVRELARRQEELARRQRELASAELPAEELKRRLESLTREQQELRQQMEELEKQSRGGRGAAGAKDQRGGEPGTKSADSAKNAGEMRRAAEQMRNAASELQRQNAGGAAASGEKAAEALRQIERQLGGSSADAGQRTAGELQLEAQQIAEGQRRIAAETTRLEKDGQGRSADALRRLAAEKDKLASRVDELHRATRQAERDMPRASGAPFRDAAAELQGQQIGNRMRASAQQMRDRASTPAASGQNQSKAQSQAQTERQLSRALDSVVDKLGGSAPGDARRLTDQLDGTREMRDRLNRLEQQVRNAEAEARAARATQRGGSEKSSGQSQQPASDRSGRGNPQGGRQAAGATGSGGDQGGASQRLQQARAEYARELQRSRDTLGRLQAEQRGGLGGSTPEQHEYSRSAPGNEAFKQDFGNWEALRKDVDSAMEQYEAAVSARLARKAAEDRLSAGGSERVPDAYRPLVSRYFEAIAKVKK